MHVAVWRNTAIVVAGYAGAILVIDRVLLRGVVPSRPLALALAFSIVQTTVIALMLITLFGWKLRGAARTRKSLRLAGDIDEALALHSIGEDQTERLRKLRDESPSDVRRKLFTVAAVTRGEARDRMSALARELQFIERRGGGGMQAIRDLISVSRADDFEQIVEWTSRQSLLARAIVADELAPFAGDVSDEQLARALVSPDRDLALATLEMLRAWRRTVRVPGVTLLLANPDPQVRAGAFATLGYVATEQPPEVFADAIAASLRDDTPGVRAAAARAAGRLGVAAVSDALAACLDDPNRSVAVAAAMALASFGSAGLTILEGVLASPNRAAAAVAFEAWEKAAMGRLEPV